MKFSTREEIDAPIDEIWAAVTDAEGFEDQARSRGIQVERHPEPEGMGLGSTWTSRFDFRGLHRDLRTSITSYEAPNLLVLDSHVGGLDAIARIELEDMERGRTRLSASLVLKPKSVPGRVLIQTLRLARNTLNDKFRNRVRRFAHEFAKA